MESARNLGDPNLIFYPLVAAAAAAAPVRPPV